MVEMIVAIAAGVFFGACIVVIVVAGAYLAVSTFRRLDKLEDQVKALQEGKG